MKTCCFAPAVRPQGIRCLLALAVLGGLAGCGTGGGDAGGGGAPASFADASFNLNQSAFNGGVRTIASAVHGSVDPGFATGAGFDRRVQTIVPVADDSGDVLVGGNFTSYDQVSSTQIIRLHSDGSKETGFAFGASFDDGTGSGVGAINEIRQANDGSGDIYVVGDFLGYNGVSSRGLVRLNADGTRDAVFDVGDGIATNDEVEAIAIAFDGSGDVYIAGQLTEYDGTSANGIVRLNPDGSREASFAVGTGFDADVLAMAAATDGSGDLYVGGFFTTYNGTSSNQIIRLNEDGSVDTAFAIGTGFNFAVFSIAMATDNSGDVYVGGGFTSYNGTSVNRLIRLNSDGTRDTGFDLGTGFDNLVLAIAPATDSSCDVYVGGRFSSYDGTSSNQIVRLTAEGLRDTDFAIGTGFAFGGGAGDTVVALAPATDGSGDLYVGGGFESYNGTSASRIIRLEVGRIFVGGNFVNVNGSIGSNHLAVLDSDDSIDTGFVVGTGFDFEVFAVAPATDGSGDAYVGGTFSSYNGTGSNFIIRLNPDGTADSDFVVGGGFDGIVFAIAPAADSSGDVYVGGQFSSYQGVNSNRIIRLNADGTIDAGFAVVSGFDFDVVTIAPATDGSGDVYVGGSFASYNGTGSERIIRINADGTRDAAFAVGAGFDGDVLSIAPAQGGSTDIYVGGRFMSYDGTSSNRIIRLDANGSIDAAFVVGSGFDFNVNAVIEATDGTGDVYAGGDFVNYDGIVSTRIIRLNADGSIDTGFPVGSGFDGSVLTLAPATDDSGDIYVGGLFLSFNGTASNGIIRLDVDGTVGVGFGLGTGFDDFVFTIAPALDGTSDVYVGGDFSMRDGVSSNSIIRLNSNGSRDAGFVVGTGFNGQVDVIAPLANGSGDVYVAGQFSLYKTVSTEGLIRLNSDGSVDLGFATGVGFNDRVLSLALAIDGSGDVYAGGCFSNYNGTSSSRIIRLNEDATPDTGFAIGVGFNGTVESIAIATDGSGDVYVGGQLFDYDGTAINNLIRLNSDGTIDSGFAVGAGFDDTVFAIAPATDGSGDVYVGGDFRSYDGTPSNRFIRLNSNGTIDTAFAVGTGFDSSVFAIVPLANGSGSVYVAGDFATYRGVDSLRIIRLQSNGASDPSFQVGAGFELGAVLFDRGVAALAEATDGSSDLYVGGAFNQYDGNQVDFAAALNPDGSLD